MDNTRSGCVPSNRSSRRIYVPRMFISTKSALLSPPAATMERKNAMKEDDHHHPLTTFPFLCMLSKMFLSVRDRHPEPRRNSNSSLYDPRNSRSRSDKLAIERTLFLHSCLEEVFCVLGSSKSQLLHPPTVPANAGLLFAFLTCPSSEQEAPGMSLSNN